MKIKSLVTHLFILVTQLLVAVHAWAISKEMQALVTYETKSNAMGIRSDQKIALENYEIPMRLVKADVAERMDPKIKNSLIFEKNGEKYIRWMINPEDTKWHKDVEALLLENGIKPERKKYFDAYQTASRSYILVDPVSGVEFSTKVSTDKTGGNWTDKKQTYEDAWQIRMVTDYVHERVKNGPSLQHIVFADEPAIYGLEKIDQGMVIREYGKLANSGYSYVPGFSIMHDATGRRIALANGSKDPAKFWNEHYNKPLARAMAEFFVLTGMTYDSPHSQNFLVELDSKERPTGRIVMRDFGDTYLSQQYFDAAGRSDIPKRWETGNVKHGISIGVGILHGNKAPAWINMDAWGYDLTTRSYNRWGKDFSEEFYTEFKKQSGIDIDPRHPTLPRNDAYFFGSIPLTNSNAKEFLHLVTQGKQRNFLMKGKCEYLFAM